MKLFIRGILFKASSFAAIALTTLIVPISPLSAAPNYFYANIASSQYQYAELSEEAKKLEKIEAQLQKQVPGLSVSYREVIDTLIAEGFHVYLKGGAVRDLLSITPCESQDIDINYTGGTPEILTSVLDQHGWTYTRKPDRFLVTIGDHRGIALEASPVNKNLDPDGNPLEVTINKIFYDCNTRTFLPISQQGLEDIRLDRLNINMDNIEVGRLYPDTDFDTKVFRFWKMVGKGYLFRAELADYFRAETLKALETAPEVFLEELYDYLGGHYYAFRDISRGCIVVMGFDWAQKHVFSIKKAAKGCYKEEQALMDQYTYHRHESTSEEGESPINTQRSPQIFSTVKVWLMSRSKSK